MGSDKTCQNLAYGPGIDINRFMTIGYSPQAGPQMNFDWCTISHAQPIDRRPRICQSSALKVGLLLLVSPVMLSLGGKPTSRRN